MHNIAVKGFAQSNVDKYNNGRPSYTSETVTQVLSIINNYIVNAKPIDSNKPHKLVELGAGTGKFTKSLVTAAMQDKEQYPWFQPHQYLATDASEAFIDSLKHLNLNISVEKGLGNQIPVPNSHSISSVLAAQSFHWFANQSALNEIHRVLLPNAPLVLIWNLFDEQTAWLHSFEEQLRIRLKATDHQVPKFADGQWKNCFNELKAKSQFAPLQYWLGHSKQVVSEQQVVDRILSVSIVSAASELEKSAIAQELRELLKSVPSFKSEDGSLLYHLTYSNHVVWTYAK